MLKRRVGAAVALVLSAVAAEAAQGDAERGAQLYETRCTGCHSLDADRVGPRHRGVYGRVAGSVEGFDYSTAVAESEVVWTKETLDRWLANPQAFIPGQRMNVRVADAADRADIIAYLKRESEAASSGE